MPHSTNPSAAPAEHGAGPTPLARLAALRARRPVPQLPIPRRPTLRAPRPRWLSSWWAARLSVNAGIPVSDFVAHRLARHLAALPVPPSRLPVVVTLDAGGVVQAAPSAAPGRRAPWLDSFLRAEGPSALGPEIQLGQADAARLAARIEAQRRRVDEIALELEEAARGAQVADPADEAQAEQMGRPRVPPPYGLGLQLLALLLLLAETWQLAVPSLEAAGIRTHDLAGELHRNPVGLVLGGVFALGASASLFLFAHLALRRTLDVFEGLPEARRRGWLVGASSAAALLAAAMAWSMAGMRPGAAHPVDLVYARCTLFLIALAIPFTTAWMLRLARALEAARADALARARAWDGEHYRAYSDLSRRAAALAEEEHRLARLEADRAAAARRIRVLQQRSIDAQRLAADAADEEEAELARLAQGIVASLELDRYEYMRQATARGLVAAPRQGPAPTPAPVRSDVGHGLGLAG
jgi:hypothetical protein